MERLAVKQSKSSPMVDFDAVGGKLIINGQSYPEDAFQFYKPILEWLKQYIASNPVQEVLIEFTLPYLNTSSSKCIMMILDIFEDANDNGMKIHLKWLINEQNEYERECAEEFKEDYSFPFEIISLQ